MRLTPEQVAASVDTLGYLAVVSIEDMTEGIRTLDIEDPRGAGLPIILMFTGSDVVATFGHRTEAELSHLSPSGLIDVIDRLMGNPSVERWSRSLHELVVKAGRRGSTRYVSSRGLFARWRNHPFVQESSEAYERVT